MKTLTVHDYYRSNIDEFKKRRMGTDVNVLTELWTHQHRIQESGKNSQVRV